MRLRAALVLVLVGVAAGACVVEEGPAPFVEALAGSTAEGDGAPTPDGGELGAPDGATAPEGGKPADAGPPKDSGAPPVGNDAQEICVAEINKWRATEGLPPLARWQPAETCVDQQCKSDSETGKAHGAFGRCGERAQNECPGWSGKPEQMIVGCLKMMWDEKFGSGQKGHYLNMKNTAYKKVACGFYVTPAGKVWAIQDFSP